MKAGKRGGRKSTPQQRKAQKLRGRKWYLKHGKQKHKSDYKSKNARPGEGPRKKPTIAEWDEAKSLNKEFNAIYALRLRCCRDLKYLWELAYQGWMRHPLTNERILQSWGMIHELAADFCHQDCINDVVTYSPLPELIPDKDRHGNYRETWLYFKTLDSPVEVCRGAKNRISEMFYSGDFWQGVIIRFKGNGLTTALLMPRGMLKTTIFGVAETERRAIKHPQERQIIRSSVSEKAEEFMEGVKYPLQFRPEFNRLFGHLVPTGREDWSKEQIRFNVPRVGLDPTMNAAGMNSEKVGSHWNRALLDDVVGEKNTTSAEMRAKTRKQYMQLQAQRDKDALLHLNGTRWTSDDVNGEMLKADADTCFMVVTALDGDESVEAPTLLTPLGYGKPIWNEYYTIEDLVFKRKEMREDWFWFGQYFNQPNVGSNKMFCREWAKPVPEQWSHLSPRELAIELNLNITVGIDTASGDPQQDKGKKDDTAVVVIGKTPDRRYTFLLDGICEKLRENEIPKAIVRKCMKWRDITLEYQGNPGSFKVGVELQRWSYFLGSVVKTEQRKLGVAAAFSVQDLKTGNRQKHQRIRQLVTPFADGIIFVPEKLMVESYRENSRGELEKPYDFIAMFMEQFLNYMPSATWDDILDALAYAWEISLPINWATPLGPQNQKEKRRGVFSRKSAPDDAQDEVANGGYDEAYFEAGSVYRQ